MAASAVVALAARRGRSRCALARRSPSRVVPAVALASAALLAAAVAGRASFARARAAIVVYLHVAAFGGALVSGFWSLVNERFDPYTARRVVGRIGTGATAGGVAGGASRWLAAQLVPVPAMLLVLAALHAAAAAVVLRARRRASPAARAGAPARAAAALPVCCARRTCARSLFVVLLGAVVEALVDFLFKAQGRRASAAARGALLARSSLFHTGMGVASLLLQADAGAAALAPAGDRGHRSRCARC